MVKLVKIPWANAGFPNSSHAKPTGLGKPSAPKSSHLGCRCQKSPHCTHRFHPGKVQAGEIWGSDRCAVVDFDAFALVSIPSGQLFLFRVRKLASVVRP